MFLLCTECAGPVDEGVLVCGRCKVKESLKPGLPATINIGSDSYPAFVTELSKSGKTVYVRRANYRRIDNNGFSENQEYEITPSDTGPVYPVYLNKNGVWKVKGMSASTVVFGIAQAYQDPHF